MAYKEGDLGYIECRNCDIFYSAVTDDDPCPLCDAKTLLLKIHSALMQPTRMDWEERIDSINEIDSLLGVE